jgi:CheY-like chemotaxis protein
MTDADTVLIIDDDDAFICLADYMITELGYRVATATNVPDALAAAAERGT